MVLNSSGYLFLLVFSHRFWFLKRQNRTKPGNFTVRTRLQEAAHNLMNIYTHIHTVIVPHAVVPVPSSGERFLPFSHPHDFLSLHNGKFQFQFLSSKDPFKELKFVYLLFHLAILYKISCKSRNFMELQY